MYYSSSAYGFFDVHRRKSSANINAMTVTPNRLPTAIPTIFDTAIPGDGVGAVLFVVVFVVGASVAANAILNIHKKTVRVILLLDAIE
mmetsp:Transcript_9445/g.10430  ORF Transcript_9445/g.10430 Transcript_9445/m.10430 type:complete len:88 (-) Transcript_9445:55-318(-)